MLLKKLIYTQKKEFDIYYKKILNSHLSNDLLSKAMIYGSMNGGKRLRPFLVSVFSNIAKIKKEQSFRISSAVESIHSYSLIHDDLPAMDNDDFRRGQKSTHRKFNEATAILAGDALHDFAFEILSDKKTHLDSEIRITLIKKLSITLGFKGLAGGQSLDLLYENKKIKMPLILKMYEMKTAKLFSFCCMAPYILAKKKDDEIFFSKKFGNLFGLIFQITDDILDQEEDFKTLGKTPGKDKKQGKSTLLSTSNKKDIRDLCYKKIVKFEKENEKFIKKNKILKDLLYLNFERLY